MERLYCIMQVDPVESHESLKVEKESREIVGFADGEGGHEPRHVSGL